MKIGILTYHRAINYGAYLQACSLCNRLNMEEGIECEIIDFHMEKEVAFYNYRKDFFLKRILHPNRYKFKKKLAKSFQKAINEPVMRKSLEYMCSDSMDDFICFVKGKYDVIIVGSDEVWKVESFRGFPTPYWLMGDLNCRKISYAVSSRSDFSKLPENMISSLKKNLQEFEMISVRESETRDALETIVEDNDKIRVYCDPSFLFDFDVRDIPLSHILGKRVHLHPDKKNLLLMTHDQKLADRIKRIYGKDYNLISVFVYHHDYKNVPDLLPIEWIEVIRNVDIVVTSFFHGVCYSMINYTPFVAIGSKNRSAKIKSLIDSGNDLANRFIEDISIFNDTEMKSFIDNRLYRPECSEYIKKNREKFEEFVKLIKDE